MFSASLQSLEEGSNRGGFLKKCNLNDFLILVYIGGLSWIRGVLYLQTSNRIISSLLGSNSGGDKIFRAHPDRPRGPSSLLYSGYRVSLLGVKQLRRDAVHPHAGVEYGQSYTSASPYMPDRHVLLQIYRYTRI